MKEKICVLYVTDWNLEKGEDTLRDPYNTVLSELDARFEVSQSVPASFEGIDLLILHPRSMTLGIFDTINLAKEKNPAIKTIVVSSARASDLFLKAIDAGVDKYLLKPISAGAVKIVAERLIQQSREAKEAKKAFHHIELMYGAISKTSLSARLDHTGKVLEVNDLLVRMLGRPAEKIIGTHWLRFVEHRFRNFLYSLVRERLRSGDIYRGVIEFVDASLGSVMVDATLYAIRDKEGEIEETVFIGHDLSEMNRAILSSMEKLINHDTSLAVLFNHRGEAITVNRNFCELGGYRDASEFFSTCGLWHWLREEEGEPVRFLEERGGQKETLETIFYLTRNDSLDGRIVLMRAPGEKRYYTLHTTSMSNPMLPGEQYHILYFVDVTELERSKEAQLSDAKLITVGRLAAAITHEINTPVTYIKGNLELLRMDCEETLPGALALFEPIEEGIRRIESIVASMYEFAGTGKEEARPFNVEMTLVYAMRIIFNRARHIVAISLNGEPFSPETAYDALSCKAFGVSTRFEQVWIIILNNALDEFEKGTISYENRRLNVDFECNSKAITVTIADNAGGIPEGLMGSLFDFAVGGDKKKSMGIGLNLAKTIIEKHGGTIRVSNREGGAVFEVALQKYEEEQ